MITTDATMINPANAMNGVINPSLSIGQLTPPTVPN